MLRERVASALVLLPLALVALYMGGWWFTALVLVFGIVATYEAFHMFRQAGYSPFTYLGIGGVVVLVGHAAWRGDTGSMTLLLAALVLLSLVRALFHESPRPATDWALTLALTVYLGFLIRFAPLLREHPHGLRWVLAALVTTWVTDSAAYFIGLSVGRHPLAPRLSPKKTWEGAIGGWMVGVIAGAVYLPWLVPGLRPLQAAVLAAAICTVAPLGDLAESMLKRQCGVKDSGRLIPGHGGALDRIDSLLFVFPTVYFFATWWS